MISTGSGEVVSWGTQPAGTSCLKAAFLDPATLFTDLIDNQGNSAVFRSTATGSAVHFI